MDCLEGKTSPPPGYRRRAEHRGCSGEVLQCVLVFTLRTPRIHVEPQPQLGVRAGRCVSPARCCCFVMACRATRASPHPNTKKRRDAGRARDGDKQRLGRSPSAADRWPATSVLGHCPTRHRTTRWRWRSARTHGFHHSHRRKNHLVSTCGTLSLTQLSSGFVTAQK